MIGCARRMYLNSDLDWDTGKPKGIKKKCRLRRISSRGPMEEKTL